ncbi:MAG: class I SAM-dependent methyltransferase [Leptolyngbya sp. SIOISBB]|nr:class I SAM-dependent methyltransferase [Leptolyngbya sp. SIOISBB]
MADALMKNKLDWEALDEKPKIRNSTPFQLHSVDTSHKWIEQTKSMLPKHLATLITLHYSLAKVGTFQERACHFYEELPDVVPDFIYLDGPDPATVVGNIGGASWQNRDRVVTSGDLLRLEPQLIPGTLIVIDGRTANARFLQAHFYRNWQINYNMASDVTVCELQEKPLGKLNQATIVYCLGKSW